MHAHSKLDSMDEDDSSKPFKALFVCKPARVNLLESFFLYQLELTVINVVWLNISS